MLLYPESLLLLIAQLFSFNPNLFNQEKWKTGGKSGAPLYFSNDNQAAVQLLPADQLLPTATNHCHLLPLTVVTWQCVIKIIDESELAFLASFAPAYRSTQPCWHHLELPVCREYMLQQPTSLLLRVAGLYQVQR